MTITHHCASRGCQAHAPFGMKHGDSYRWACLTHRDLIEPAPLSSPGAAHQEGRVASPAPARPSELSKQGSLW